MSNNIKFVFSEDVLRIVNNRQLTQREKVGHLDCLIRQGWDQSNVEKLEKLLKWATGKPAPRFVGAFDPDTRVFRLHFPKDVYFNGGGMIYHNMILQFFAKMNWPYISYQGATFWVGYFPHFEKVEVAEEAAKPVENKPVTQQVQEAPKPEEQVKAPKKEVKPKAVRNIKRKPKTEQYTINPDEMDADE